MLSALVALAHGHAPAQPRLRLAPSPRAAAGADAAAGGLPPAQWRALTRRLAELPQPRVPLAPTSAALPDRPGRADLPPAALG